LILDLYKTLRYHGEIAGMFCASSHKFKSLCATDL